MVRKRKLPAIELKKVRAGLGVLEASVCAQQVSHSWVAVWPAQPISEMQGSMYVFTLFSDPVSCKPVRSQRSPTLLLG